MKDTIPVINGSVELPTQFVTVQYAISGYMAVHVWTNCKDIPGECFHEPYDTGIGRYATKDPAIKEAESMAQELNIPYVGDLQSGK